jgi:hypothetical protein
MATLFYTTGAPGANKGAGFKRFETIELTVAASHTLYAEGFAPERGFIAETATVERGAVLI